MCRYLLLFFLLFYGSAFIFAQHKSYLEEVQISGGSTVATPEYAWKSEDAASVIKEAAQYIVDPVDGVASEAVAVMSLAALDSTDKKLRRHVVEMLTVALGYQGNSTAAAANRYLARFSFDDFSEEAIRMLTSFLQNVRNYNYVGVARMAAEKGFGIGALVQVFHANGLNLQKKWDISICLSRLDYVPAIQWIAGKIERAGNPFVVIEVAKDLIYTRQRSLIGFCVDVLKNKDLKCESVNPDVMSKIDCGYRIMELVGPVIKDFPVKFDNLGMLGSDKEYEAALRTVRLWLEQNPDYELYFDTDK